MIRDFHATLSGARECQLECEVSTVGLLRLHSAALAHPAFANSSAGQRYEQTASGIEAALRFMRACGVSSADVELAA